ncbi:hypothetical protein BC943DRAFT_215769 [Umbelopsis sp. AD052]|nr:hypothetical protein BC943DRAFT_215769 [Umbelopsis sp. AD052]
MGRRKGKSASDAGPQTLRRSRRLQKHFLADDGWGTQGLSRLLQELGFCTKEMAGDGNCLFRALSDQYHGNDKQHAEIRQSVCQFLRENEESYEMFVEDDQTFQWHVDNMENLGVFGGNMELAAFAKLQKIDIKIYQPGFIYIINGGDDPEEVRQTLHIAYHSWEHYSSVRKIDGPSQGPTEIKDRPIERSVSSEPTAKEKTVLNACPQATLSQVRKMLITHNQDVDEAIEALYESEYQNDPVEEDASLSPSNVDEVTATPEEVASSPEKALLGTPDIPNDHDGQSQESGADDTRKRKRLTARDRKMQAKMKQKQQRKAKKKPAEEEQQEAKVTSELRQLYI